MQDVPIKPFIIGVIFASFLWAMVVFAFNFETKVPHPDDWDSRFEVYETAVTEDRELFDTEAGRTVLWTPGNPKVNAVEVRKISDDRWQVILEKVY